MYLIIHLPTLAQNDTDLNRYFVSSGNRTWAYTGLPFGQPLWLVAALVNRLAPFAWLSSGDLEVYRFRLPYDYDTIMTVMSLMLKRSTRLFGDLSLRWRTCNTSSKCLPTVPKLLFDLCEFLFYFSTDDGSSFLFHTNSPSTGVSSI